MPVRKRTFKNTPCLSRIVNKGGYSYVSAGRRPKNLTILGAKMLLKVCFCSGNRWFCIGKAQIFPPAAGQQHKISIFIDFDESNLSPKLHTRIPPLFVPDRQQGGVFLCVGRPQAENFDHFGGENAVKSVFL